MTNTTLSEKIVSIRGRYLLIVMALLRNCSLVGIYNQVGFLQTTFPTEPALTIQAI